MTSLRLPVSVVFALLFAACSNDLPGAQSCSSSADCPTGSCVGGTCQPAGTDGGGSNNLFPDGGDEQIPPDAGRSVSPNDPNNTTKDTDCDGLSDAEEFGTKYAGGQKTDPANPDSDGDGIPDGVEAGKKASPDATCAGFKGDADDTTRTSPVNADTDGDGIADGVEDKNHNGKVDPGEQSPTNTDTDGDGLPDAVEDKNKNGVTDPGETSAAIRDTDGDKIPDGVEDANKNGAVDANETDPNRADTDGDGCLDGDEDKNWNHVVDAGESDPRKAGDCGVALSRDTDCDGLADKDEDRNNNGAVDPGETSRTIADTDGDGLLDGLEQGVTGNPDPTNCAAFKADVDSGSRTNPLWVDSDCDGVRDAEEDANKNGRVDPGETDPNKRDSDGDGLDDGLEKGLCTSPDPAHCAAVFKADADCGTTKTDPTNADTDGDGIADGAEDANQNGRVDSGELNPGNNADGTGPAADACSTANLKKMSFLESSAADLQLAASLDYTETARVSVGGVERALMIYSPTQKIAGVAMLVNPTGADASADEAAGRTRLSALGAISNNTAQTATTWDKFSSSRALFDFGGTTDLKTRANDVVKAFVGSSATGLLAGAAGISGPFKVEASYVRRSSTRTVVVLALMPATSFPASKPFVLSDVSGGTALAQFGDANAPQCETFLTKNTAAVDFVWLVDNSCSMASYQQAVANAGTAMMQKLGNANIDWRMGATTSSYYSSTSGANGWRAFTTNQSTIQGWFTQSGTGWFGTSGNVTEELLQSGKALVTNQLLPASGTSDANKLRQNATLAFILLGDADDQSATSIASFTSFYSSYDGAGSKAQVHGILCPDADTCSESQNTPRKNSGVVRNLGGVLGDINQANTGGGSLGPTIDAILNAAIAGASPYALQKPPIAATLKLAVDAAALPAGSTCNAKDVPRDRTNGFDYDPVSQRLLFFGDCRPAAAGKSAAVSYRYWVDLTPNPNGNPDPCGNCVAPLVCDRLAQKCVCPSDCGTTSPGAGYVCDTGTCKYTCAPDCNGACNGNQTCNTSTCSCQCNQNVTCAPGTKFDAAACACVCDTAALGCGAAYSADPALCACVCKPNCGGTCANGTSCNMSTCGCGTGPT